MNLIINGFNGELLPVVYNIMSQLNIEYCSAISTDQVKFPANIKGDNHDYENCKLGIYNVDWNFIRPLDRELIDKMTDCETVVLKMIERLGPAGVDVRHYNARKKMYLRHLRYWNNLVISKNIDLAVFSTIPHVIYDYIIYALCKLYEIPTVMMYRMPILPHKNVLLYTLDDFKKPGFEVIEQYRNKLKNNFLGTNIPSSQATISYFDAHSSKTNVPKGYTNPGQKEDVKGIASKVRKKAHSIANAIRITFIDKNFAHLVEYLKFRSFRAFKNRFYSRHVVAPDLSKKYLYLALHYQPECTTSPMAGAFVDQSLMIQLISYLLPDDVFLYVKEHPRDNLLFDKEFYAELSSIRNVILVPAQFCNYKLIDNSIAVATATGTAGWEALLRGKPVLMFGYYFYQYAPGVFHINTVEDCKNALDKILNGKCDIETDKLKIFLDSMNDISFNGYVDFRYGDVATFTAQDNVINISNALLNKIKAIHKQESLNCT